MCILAWVKTIWCKFQLVDEFCHDCGRKTQYAWTIENWFWDLVVGRDDTILCLKCFDKRAEKRNLHPIYRIEVENIPIEIQKKLDSEFGAK